MSRARALDEEIAAARNAIPDLAVVQASVEAFEPVWCSLSPTERARLLALVISHVTFDAKAGSITLALHDTGGPSAGETA